MNTYIISDTHFNHKMLIDKGYRIDGYEDIIWHNLAQLPYDSLLIHLGDICIGNDISVHDSISQLRYKKVLVKGNHENRSNHWYLQHGWDFVCDHFQDTYFGKKIVFSHIPLKDHGFDLNIHGHFHTKSREKYIKEYNEILSDKHKLVSLEGLGYKPILLERLIK